MVEKFLKYDDIIIQCHDIPDADTIACGFALLKHLEDLGARPKLLYSGKNKITKPNLLWMIKLLQIPLVFVSEISECQLLITVDCQHGAGNVTNLPAQNIAVFDHHVPEIEVKEDIIIRPELGSCSTLVWDILAEEGFDFKKNKKVYDALYYGLYTDTNGLSEMWHPLDRDLADFLPHNKSFMKKMKSSALTISELSIVSQALSEPDLICNIGLLEAPECDPNILGFSSDIAQQVEQFDSCVVYCKLGQGLKLSIRSAIREIMANDFASYLAKDIGSGGGSYEKAGAFINLQKIDEKSPRDYLEKRIKDYCTAYDYIYCDKHSIAFNETECYRKLPLPVGYVPSTDVFEEGTPIVIRTLEGDIETLSDSEIIFIIGILGEVYPIKRERFKIGYKKLNEEYLANTDYTPVVTNRISGERKLLKNYASSCIPAESKIIYAKQLKKRAKVFSKWDLDKYFLGNIGDYIAAPVDDTNDVYIIRESIFYETYEKYL